MKFHVLNTTLGANMNRVREIRRMRILNILEDFRNNIYTSLSRRRLSVTLRVFRVCAHVHKNMPGMMMELSEVTCELLSKSLRRTHGF